MFAQTTRARPIIPREVIAPRSRQTLARQTLARKTLAHATRAAFAIALALSAGPAGAHEFWIEAADYQLESGARIQADLVNGERFAGARLFYNPSGFERFELITGDLVADVPGRLGDRPAIDLQGLPDGLHVFVHQTRPTWLQYESWAKFETFVEHKDLGDMAARHAARGLSQDDVREAYSRYAKALVATGDGAGADAPTGLEIEIVALANPYVAPLDAMPVRVLLRGAPRANVQVELFEKAPSGAVDVTLHRTDDSGVAVLPVKPGHRYLVDSVHLREPSAALAGATEAHWETLWASLTFAVTDE